MERMAAKVEQTKFIHPNTAQEMTRFIDQHWHDCDKAACSTQLQTRNRTTRNHLKALIAERMSLNERAGITSLSLIPAQAPPTR
jgi:Asp/Glu/hydantoin racemase